MSEETLPRKLSNKATKRWEESAAAEEKYGCAIGSRAGYAIRPGHVSIPAEPPLGLLQSMALRYDHAWGMPSMFADDVAIEAARRSEDWSVAIMAKQTLTTREREVILSIMRQLHEEVVGKGFYRYDV